MKENHVYLSKKVIFSLSVLIVLVSTAFAVFYFNKDDSKSLTKSNASSNQSKVSTNKTNPTHVKTTEEQLVYLIEEEKLAHDVYTIMYQKYGANVFGNILESESNHQNRVLVLLQTRNIPDPRSSDVGVFVNPELQKLYDSLIDRGNTNATEAYKAGIAIEEKDITDISNLLSTTTDQDLITTLESLRSGSENHLRAFNRQL